MKTAKELLLEFTALGLGDPDMLAEHWDVIQDEVAPGLTASGNAQFTNPQQSV